MYASFHGKVLLFGEYTVFSGSRALVTPLRRFSGRLQVPDGRGRHVPGMDESNRMLARFLEYLKRVPDRNNAGHADRVGGTRDPEYPAHMLDLDLMGREIERGLYFDSSVPQEYGAGSSAALVAAVYDAFSKDGIRKSSTQPHELSLLRKIFSRMESMFHGTSSGIDPVCCYTSETILVDASRMVPVRIPAPGPGCRFFLADAGIKGETGPMVLDFRRKMEEDTAFANVIKNVLIPLTADCIGNLLAGSQQEFASSLKKLSECQFNNFGPQIPGRIRKTWEEGIDSDLYTLKLCGSGGGGYFLGCSGKWEETEERFRKTDLQILTLDL